MNKLTFYKLLKSENLSSSISSSFKDILTKSGTDYKLISSVPDSTIYKTDIYKTDGYNYFSRKKIISSEPTKLQDLRYYFQ